jgi:3-phosphoshikimate 1-carboxyvinyltransferase
VTDFLAFPPAGAVRGTVRAPSSKSATNRALLLAAIGADPVELIGPLDSEDTRALAVCLEAMGAQIAPTDRGVLVRGPLGRAPGRPIRLDAGASGTAARFLAAVAAAVPGDWRLDGEPRLRERPIAELVAALVSAGASVRYEERDGFLPLGIAGGTLRGGERVAVDASRSSQFLSALLLAGAATEKGISVRPVGAVASAPYADTTVEILAEFGYDARRSADGTIDVRRGDGTGPRSYAVPGDWSSALPFLVAAGIAGGEVEIEGLAWPSSDADARASRVIEEMGVVVRRDAGSIHARAEEGGLRPVSISARDFPDAVPALAALAAHAAGESRFRDVAHLRGKESDRLDAIVKLFTAAGVRASAGGDELAVTGPSRSVSGLMRLPTFGDHRIAMAAALISLSSAGALIENPGCVSKSYPRFFRDLETILVRG